jgi:hypothetical protein
LDHAYNFFMARQLTDDEVRSTLVTLLEARPQVSGRSLRRALRARYGAVGRTARVFQIWREMTGERPRGTVELTDYAGAQIRAAEARVHAAELRATRAEEREQAHQDKWAVEIHALREQLSQHESSMPRSGVPHETYHRLYAAYLEVRRRLMRYEPELGPTQAVAAPIPTKPDK